MKNAAFLALAGTLLLAILLILDFIGDVLGTVRGLVPPVRLFASAIQTFAGVTVAAFFYVFHKSQS